MAMLRKPRAGFVGFGEVNTPKELIVNRSAAAATMLEQAGLELLVTAPVSDDPQGNEAARARIGGAGEAPERVPVAIADRRRGRRQVDLAAASVASPGARGGARHIERAEREECARDTCQTDS